ncbi:kinase-like protein [Artomyces pyxidatus]|uniref:Kinase-like protein n=1 Tax=Artomyces pyxidatus TaxID=48021 RepID=A0ACB8SY16_9AGAM|nr:kinase-like protein [Artomyces pyxidatus]
MERLGSGGFGVVYRAEDFYGTGRQYAVKCLRRTPDTAEHQRQCRECWAHGEVSDHPNVITFHDTAVDEQYFFMIFDYCPGGDLYGMIAKSRMFYRKDDLIKRVFVQLLDAVQHCVDNGVFHRDLKPENVLCSLDGSQIYLTDFGLAAKANYTSRHGIGSRSTMSPEALGEEVYLTSYSVTNSDVWSLGIILCNMVSGHCPWHEATTRDKRFREFLSNPYDLRRNIPISRELCALLMRVFTFNPFARISLQTFREEVGKIDRFFMSEEDMAYSPDRIRELASGYAKRGPTPLPSGMSSWGDDEFDLAEGSRVVLVRRRYRAAPASPEFEGAAENPVAPAISAVGDVVLTDPWLAYMREHEAPESDVEIIDLTAPGLCPRPVEPPVLRVKTPILCPLWLDGQGA